MYDAEISAARRIPAGTEFTVRALPVDGQPPDLSPVVVGGVSRTPVYDLALALRNKWPHHPELALLQVWKEGKGFVVLVAGKVVAQSMTRNGLRLAFNQYAAKIHES